MDIRKMLVSEDPELNDFLNSEQYKLSRSILKLRYKHSLKPADVASLLDISKIDYLKIESGDNRINTEVYERTFNKMKDILETKKWEVEFEVKNRVANLEQNYNIKINDVAIDKIAMKIDSVLSPQIMERKEYNFDDYNRNNQFEVYQQNSSVRMAF